MVSFGFQKFRFMATMHFWMCKIKRVYGDSPKSCSMTPRLCSIGRFNLPGNLKEKKHHLFLHCNAEVPGKDLFPCVQFYI